jgi:prepilin-type processing-associated H-X9-DG protein
MGVLLVIGALLWPAVNAARQAAQLASCIGQNKFMALPMLIYEDKNGCFPPAYIADKQGRPAHSWRVLMLQLDMPEIYKRYHFDESWNSPHNRELAGGLPMGMSGVYPWYHCATDVASDRLDTSYVMVVGPNTISSGAKSRTIKEITDGLSNTVLIAEMSESGIHWMEPRDLNFEKMSFKINDKSGVGIRSKHPGGVVVSMADGHQQVLSENTDPDVVKALFTINGNEPLPPEF